MKLCIFYLILKLFWLSKLILCFTILEDFNDIKYQDRWVRSRNEFIGAQFGWSAGNDFLDFKSDLGLQANINNTNYGISLKFNPFSNLEDHLILQFQVKFEKWGCCDGGYIKLLNSKFIPESFNSETPYLIMFGPDSCIHEAKRLMILLGHRGRNIQNNRHHAAPDDGRTHLYTLVITPQNTYSVYIDNQYIFGGNIEDGWNLIEPKTIDDPNITKPEDWVEEQNVLDESAKKPEYWVEIKQIPDPNVTRPDDWEDEFDGPWIQPMIENPEYRGEWEPPLKTNPKYRGPWVQPQIPNPKYVQDHFLYLMDDIGGIGIEIKHMDSQVKFDNILVTNDIDLAKKYSQETWKPLFEHETSVIKYRKKPYDVYPEDFEGNVDPNALKKTEL